MLLEGDGRVKALAVLLNNQDIPCRCSHGHRVLHLMNQMLNDQLSNPKRVNSNTANSRKPPLWLQSYMYLSDLMQYVSVNGGTSVKRHLGCAVPQRSALGPILYLLYTSPLSDIKRKFNSSHHFYTYITPLLLLLAKYTW